MPKNKQDEQIFMRRLSPNQFALMRAVAEGEAHEGDDTLAILNYVTFGALVKRGYLTIDGRHNPVMTNAGLGAYETYRDMEMPHRQQPGQVTDFRCLHARPAEGAQWP